MLHISDFRHWQGGNEVSKLILSCSPIEMVMDNEYLLEANRDFGGQYWEINNLYEESVGWCNVVCKLNDDIKKCERDIKFWRRCVKHKETSFAHKDDKQYERSYKNHMIGRGTIHTSLYVQGMRTTGGVDCKVLVCWPHIKM